MSNAPLDSSESLAALSSNADSYRLEEYKALRAEILANMDYQKMIIVWGTAGVATIFGFIFGKSGNPQFTYLAIFLAQVVSSVFLYVWERISYTTECIGTYIGVALERYEGLGWELYQRSPLEPFGRTKSKSTTSRILMAVTIMPFVAAATISWVFIGFRSFPVHVAGDDQPASVIDFGSLFGWVRVGSWILYVLIIGWTVMNEFVFKDTDRLWRDTLNQYKMCLIQRGKKYETWRIGA